MVHPVKLYIYPKVILNFVTSIYLFFYLISTTSSQYVIHVGENEILPDLQSVYNGLCPQILSLSLVMVLNAATRATQ